MTLPQAVEPLDRRHVLALARACALIESPDFASKLSDYAGQPMRRALALIPDGARRRLNAIVEAAVLQCLTIAVRSLDRDPRRRPSSQSAAVLAGISGGVSGFVGLAALPLELPITTTLILRAIADIARFHGEDLLKLEARLACVEVLGLGGQRAEAKAGFGYYASRAMFARLVGDASSLIVERGVAGATAPVLTGLAAEIAPRYGVVVAERAAASAVPVLGALGGASVNLLFMKHFQRIAHGHFTVRRLERRYGAAAVRSQYQDLAAGRAIA